MSTDKKIEQIRQLMKTKDIAAIIIPSDDPHKSEYVAEHWQARKWLTGFSGSAGTAVVTRTQAILWTDSRYYIQAQDQILDSEFILFKMGEPDVPDLEKWLKQKFNPGDIVGLDGNLFSASNIKKIKKKLDPKEIKLDTDIDFISELWEGRPARPASQAYLFPEKYAGQSCGDKLGLIRDKIIEHGADCHFVSTLDDIAWTLNLRGSDVHTNPVNIAFLLIKAGRVSLFMEKEKADAKIIATLKNDGVDIFDYQDIAQALAGLPDKTSILIDPENTNYSLQQAVNSKCKIIEKPNPAIALKAVKNDVQIQHLRQTAVKDGIAVVNFLFWLEHQEKNQIITEQSAAKVLYNFRKEQDLFVDNSFDPIIAWEDHSAMVHYSATDKTDVTIGLNGMLLADSGGNYLTGTTDITRTVCRGIPLKQAVTDYTLVLKGHIALASALFPKGTKGFQVDTLARQYLWNQGLDFGHGTGHGVGFFLCVHEGPARISPFPTDVKLERGMLLTNEPGLYRNGQYGIRLENMVLVEQAFENEFGSFLKFENMTWCHFETSLMDKKMLSIKEIEWVNNYNAQVYEKLHPGLKPEVAEWLKDKTGPI